MNYLKYQLLSGPAFSINNNTVDSKAFNDQLEKLDALYYSRSRTDSNFGYVVNEFGLKGNSGNRQVYRIKFASDLGYQFNSIDPITQSSDRLYFYNDEVVSEQKFKELQSALAEVPKTWYCKEMRDGGETGFDATDREGTIYHIRMISREKCSYTSLMAHHDFGDITADAPDLETALKLNSVRLEKSRIFRIDSSKTQKHFTDLRVIMITAQNQPDKNFPPSGKLYLVSASKKTAKDFRSILNLTLSLSDSTGFSLDLSEDMMIRKNRMTNKNIVEVAEELAYLNAGGGRHVSVLTDATSDTLPYFPKDWKAKFENPKTQMNGNQYWTDVFTYSYRPDAGIRLELMKHRVIIGDRIHVQSTLIDSKALK